MWYGLKPGGMTAGAFQEIPLEVRSQEGIYNATTDSFFFYLELLNAHWFWIVRAVKVFNSVKEN